jgi:hypothetical protein
MEAAPRAANAGQRLLLNDASPKMLKRWGYHSMTSHAPDLQYLLKL